MIRKLLALTTIALAITAAAPYASAMQDPSADGQVVLKIAGGTLRGENHVSVAPPATIEVVVSTDGMRGGASGTLMLVSAVADEDGIILPDTAALLAAESNTGGTLAYSLDINPESAGAIYAFRAFLLFQGQFYESNTMFVVVDPEGTLYPEIPPPVIEPTGDDADGDGIPDGVRDDAAGDVLPDGTINDQNLKPGVVIDDSATITRTRKG